MLEKNNEIEAPKVEFTFFEEEKSEEEQQKEIEELLKKRNEILASMGLSIPDNDKTETNEINDDYPRHTI